MTPVVTRRGVGLVGTCTGATKAGAGFADLPAVDAVGLATGLRTGAGAGAAATLRAGIVELRIGAALFLTTAALRALLAIFLTTAFFATGRRAGTAFFAATRTGAGLAALRAGAAFPRATALTFETTFCISLPTIPLDDSLRPLDLATGRLAGFAFLAAALAGAFALRVGAGFDLGFAREPAAGLDFDLDLLLVALDFLAAATGLRVARLAIENFSGLDESGVEGELRIQGWPEGALL